MRIENAHYVVELDPVSGALRRLYDRVGAVELLAHDRLAESFRLLLPLPELEANYVLGTEQRLSSVDQSADGVVLRWDGPLTNAQGEWDLDVETRIALVGEAVELRTTVRNRTAHRLAEVWQAGLGGLMGVGDRATTRTTLPKTRGPDAEWMFRQFPESMGVGAGGGMRFAEYYVRYPVEIGMPWLDMSSQALDRGFYYGCHDETPRLATLRFEMHPGLARNRLSGNWPSDAEIATTADQYPPGLVAHWVHMPYTPPGETFVGPPVVVRAHAGDWHAAARIYRAWFRERFPVPASGANWLRREQAVQDAMFLLPEGNVMLTFKEIGRWAREARDFGVTTVMISGWNVGGHDNQYPNYTPDPRLGTWEELAEGIAECHRLGVRVLFFANIQTVDVSTDLYRHDLHRYRMMDARGHTNASGWGMGTLGARMGLTRPPIAGCNPAFPAFRRVVTEHMRKLAEIGADGIHYDKAWGAPGHDFNPELPVPGDESWFRGTLQCLEETLAAGRVTRPDFGLGIESTWDRCLSYCDAWWLWNDTLDHVPAMKYAFPEFMAMFPVVQPWDYNNANNAIRYGYQLLMGPVRYSASMADAQSRPIATYVAELLRLREELKETIFFGEFLDVLETSVAPSPHLRFNTHRNPRTGQRACVLVNQAETPVETTVSFEGADGALLLYEPFAPPRRVTSPLTVSVPGERLAIVVEA